MKPEQLPSSKVEKYHSIVLHGRPVRVYFNPHSNTSTMTRDIYIHLLMKGEATRDGPYGKASVSINSPTFQVDLLAD